ncbi:MAG TPA: hypothetical protein VEB20_03495 [Azospirillaceae bacterium]|nr:hypothetical protein [Azospirillaceae bacterium]
MNSLNAYLLPLCVAFAGNLLYHVASRGAPRDAAPLWLLSVAYLVASAAAGVVAWRLHGTGGLSRNLLSCATPVLALAVIMIEAGFLLAYRSGASVGTASLLVNAGVAAALIVVGSVVFAESYSLQTWAGVLLTLLGVLLTASARNPAS